MKTLEQVAHEAVTNMINSGKIEELVTTNIEKAIGSAIETQFRSYGGITKQIEEAINEGLKIDISEIPFDSYNAQMLVAVRQRLNGMFKGQAYEHFMGQIEKTLNPAPAEMPFGDFLEALAEMMKTDEPWDSDLYECMKVEVTPHRSFLEKEDSNDWNVEIKFSNSSVDELKLFILDGKIRISHRQCFNPTCIRDAEAYVFKLYGAGNKADGHW